MIIHRGIQIQARSLRDGPRWTHRPYFWPVAAFHILRASSSVIGGLKYRHRVWKAVNILEVRRPDTSEVHNKTETRLLQNVSVRFLRSSIRGGLACASKFGPCQHRFHVDEYAGPYLHLVLVYSTPCFLLDGGRVALLHLQFGASLTDGLVYDFYAVVHKLCAPFPIGCWCNVKSRPIASYQCHRVGDMHKTHQPVRAIWIDKPRPVRSLSHSVLPFDPCPAYLRPRGSGAQQWHHLVAYIRSEYL